MNFFETLLAAIAPHRCVGCNNEGSLLCEDCRGQLQVRRPGCYNCQSLTGDWRTCEDCQPSSALEGVMVAAHYDSAAGELVRGLKYHSQVAATRSLSDLLTPLLSPANFDVVTAIPGAPSHYRSRGYHQAELIGRRTARGLHLPYRSLLGRLEVQSQVGLSRAERLEQVKYSFWVRSGSVVGQRVLVIDDVLTTGATLSEAAKVLRDAGAKSVWGAAVVRD